jgi:putative hydrolase of the HAD superfamily
MDAAPGVRAVLLDALGTLLRLEPPAPRLREELRRRAGIEVDEATAQRGFEGEIAYYLQHHLEGRDPDSLEDLRARCAAAMVEAMGLDGLDPAAARAAMLGSLEFTPFADVVPALGLLRERGLRLVVASNWDCSLPDWLERAGLGGLLDGAVSSAVVGRAKPAPDVFLEALRLAGAEPGEAVHVGDSPGNDVEGARAAGVRPLLLVRDGEAPPGMAAIRSLAELPSLI